MIWKTNRRAAQRPKPHLSQCRNCPMDSNCPHSNHYTVHGGCVIRAHNCGEFRPKDWRKIDGEIRKKNKFRFWGSKHERLSITDIERSMARGETDIIGITRQVPFPLGLRAGSNSVYIADALATLEPGGKFTHRIYEPKGAKTPIYLLKRRVVQLLYPNVEFVEIVQ